MTDEASRPDVSLSNRQELPVDEAGLSELAARTLIGEGLARAELSISLVGVEEMARLHERYLGEPGPTDVMAFPMDEDEGPEGSRMLGDVVVCPPVAAEQGSPDEELRLLVVHGILHLLGYDHETEEDRARMWPRQERYSGVSA